MKNPADARASRNAPDSGATAWTGVLLTWLIVAVFAAALIAPAIPPLGG
jgi:hypothetical protein